MVVSDVPGGLPARLVPVVASVALVGSDLSLIQKVKEPFAGVAVEAPRAEVPRSRRWINRLHQYSAFPSSPHFPEYIMGAGSSSKTESPVSYFPSGASNVAPMWLPGIRGQRTLYNFMPSCFEALIPITVPMDVILE